MKSTRAYVMRARAESAAATRQRILDAAVAEVWCRRVSDVRLDDIAARSEVTVQTILRVFGTRARLIDEACEVNGHRIREQRSAAAPGDIPGTVRALFDHYEEMGDFVIRNLAQEDELPELKEWLAHGRKAHRQSMQRQFAPWLEALDSPDRRATLDCLICACDVYTWKLLRRDMQRSRSDAEARVRQMVSGTLGGS